MSSERETHFISFHFTQWVDITCISGKLGYGEDIVSCEEEGTSYGEKKILPMQKTDVLRWRTPREGSFKASKTSRVLETLPGRKQAPWKTYRGGDFACGERPVRKTSPEQNIL